MRRLFLARWWSSYINLVNHNDFKARKVKVQNDHLMLPRTYHLQTDEKVQEVSGIIS